MASKRRTYRVAEKIRAIVASELLRVTDPRLELVTVTSVSLSGDLRHARVYWMVMGGADRIPDAEAGFAKAVGHFRSALAKDLGTKFVPELKFFYDDTLDATERVERLLAEAKQPEAKDENEQSEQPD